MHGNPERPVEKPDDASQPGLQIGRQFEEEKAEHGGPESPVSSDIDPTERDPEAAAPDRAQSPHLSTRSRALSIVPRAKRRGILAWLTILPEVERPYDYANSAKWAITVFTALAGCIAPMGSAIFYRKTVSLFPETFFLLQISQRLFLKCQRT
jgi:hypothetical protein